MSSDIAKKIVDAILNDLLDRPGVGFALNNISEDDWSEMTETLADIVDKHLAETNGK